MTNFDISPATRVQALRAYLLESGDPLWPAVEATIRAAVAAETERCARLVEQNSEGISVALTAFGRGLALAIRARREEPDLLGTMEGESWDEFRANLKRARGEGEGR